MAILSRFKDIVSSNIGALIDKAENPEKLIDKLLLDALEDLAEVKQDTAEVMADETRARERLDAASAAVKKYEDLAYRALKAGSEDDARVFLTEKQARAKEMATAQRFYDVAHENAERMRTLHDKLTDDIEQLRLRKASITAKLAAAEAQTKINELDDARRGAAGKLDRLEAEAERRLDEATAAGELGKDPLASLEEKYSSDSDSAAVEDELAAMKARLGGEE